LVAKAEKSGHALVYFYLFKTPHCVGFGFHCFQCDDMSADDSKQLDLSYRLITPPRGEKDSQDLNVVYFLEQASYPEDEAASFNSLVLRATKANPYFMLAELQDGSGKQIVGFVNGTLASKRKLSHDTMTSHDAQGHYLCIHSVVVKSELRRNNIGSKMVKEYLTYLKREQSHLESVLLLAKQGLVPFYEGAGFRKIGLSDVVHGKEAWYECEYVMPASSDRQADSTTDSPSS